MTLTDSDRDLITRARKLAGVSGTGAIREHTGEPDNAMAYAVAFGQARVMLEALTALTQRLESEVSRLRNDRARYRAQLHLAPDGDDREALREAGQPGRLAGK